MSLSLVAVMTICCGWTGGGLAWSAPQTKKNIRVAQANASHHAAVKQSSAPKTTFPTAAWTVESIGAVLGAVGVIAIGFGTSFLNESKNLEKKAINSTKLEDVPTAQEVKSQQDTGTGLIVGGWVVAGVGVTVMVVGAIWLLAHKPKSAPLPPMNQGAKQTRQSSLLLPNSTTLMSLE